MAREQPVDSLSDLLSTYGLVKPDFKSKTSLKVKVLDFVKSGGPGEVSNLARVDDNHG